MTYDERLQFAMDAEKRERKDIAQAAEAVFLSIKTTIVYLFIKL